MTDAPEQWNFEGDDEEIVRVELAPGLGILIWIALAFAAMILGVGVWYLISVFG